MKIATVVGARPQFIKAATVSRIIKQYPTINEIIIHTGQHYDENMSDVFFNELNIPIPQYNLEIGSFSHGKQTGRMLEKIEEVFLREKPDWVLVYGDTNSTIAGALAASKLHIPIAHVEAGLRSYNRRMPEEINRIVTDHVSDKLFVPTQNAMTILAAEGLKDKGIFTGDVMYDSICYYKEIARQKVKLEDVVDVESGKYYIATIHRQENTDDLKKLQEIFLAFSELDMPVIVPLHPRTRNILDEVSFRSNVKIIDPVGYLEMVCLLDNCAKVFTDSGGLQKEAYFLQKPCITLRDETEWIETLEGNWNFTVGADKQKMLDMVNIKNFAPQKNAFGDGNAAKIIVESLVK